MANSTDAQRQALQQQIQSNPAIVQALLAEDKKPKLPAKTVPKGAERAKYARPQADVLKDFGITLPGDAQIGVNPQTGETTVQHQSWFNRNAGWVVPLAFFATAGTASALAGGAAGAGGGTAAGAGGASTATTAGAGTGIAGGTAATTAAATSPSLLHSLLPTIIGAGTSVAGGLIQAHSASEATKAQTEAADKAIALQKEQYALQRQDTAPYRALGQGAVGNLGYLSGIDTQSAVPALSATVPTQPYGTLPPTQAAPAASQAPSMVQVKSPTGQVGMVPAARLNDALAAGGTRV